MVRVFGHQEDRESSYWFRVLLCTEVSAVGFYRPEPNASSMLTFTTKASSKLCFLYFWLNLLGAEIGYTAESLDVGFQLFKGLDGVCSR